MSGPASCTVPMGVDTGLGELFLGPGHAGQRPGRLHTKVNKVGGHGDAAGGDILVVVEEGRAAPVGLSCICATISCRLHRLPWSHSELPRVCAARAQAAPPPANQTAFVHALWAACGFHSVLAHAPEDRKDLVTMETPSSRGDLSLSPPSVWATCSRGQNQTSTQAREEAAGAAL